MAKLAHGIAAFLCVLLLLVLTAAGASVESPRISALDEGELISLRNQWTPAANSPESGFCDYVYVIPELKGSAHTIRLEGGSRNGQRVLSRNSCPGSSNAVFAQFIHANLYALIFGCFTTLLGCIVLAGGYALGYRRRSGRVHGSVFLALFMFLSGMWVVCGSRLPMLFSGNTVRVYPFRDPISQS